MATERTPDTHSAAPSSGPRVLAVAAIIVAGVCGGLIGYAFTDLQCDDGCPALAGGVGVLGAIIAAVGVAIVAVLTLRAMAEWEASERAKQVESESQG